MRGANVGSGNTVPLRVIPERRDFPEHRIQSARAKGADVLDDDPRRPAFLDEPAVLAPEAGSLSGEPCPLAGGADILAGEASANNVNWPNVEGVEFAHVLEAGDGRPVLSQDGLAVGVDLAEGDGAESPGAFEPEAESADAAEQVEDSEHVIAALDRSCRRQQRRPRGSDAPPARMGTPRGDAFCSRRDTGAPALIGAAQPLAIP